MTTHPPLVVILGRGLVLVGEVANVRNDLLLAEGAQQCRDLLIRDSAAVSRALEGESTHQRRELEVVQVILHSLHVASGDARLVLTEGLTTLEGRR